jgi:hypothetical protein
MPDALQPFHAFLVLDRPPLALLRLAILLGWTHPGLQAQHAQRQAVGCDGQQAVHHESAQIVAGAIAQTFGGGKMRQIEFGGVLCGQHDGNLLHAAERLQDVRSQHPIGIDLRIVEEAIRRLKLGPVERTAETSTADSAPADARVRRVAASGARRPDPPRRTRRSPNRQGHRCQTMRYITVNEVARS